MITRYTQGCDHVLAESPEGELCYVSDVELQLGLANDSVRRMRALIVGFLITVEEGLCSPERIDQVKRELAQIP